MNYDALLALSTAPISVGACKEYGVTPAEYARAVEQEIDFIVKLTWETMSETERRAVIKHYYEQRRV